MSQDAFNDEMLDIYLHLVNLDYDRVYAETRQWANGYEPFRNKMDEKGGWWQVKKEVCPENYGFNIIGLKVPKPGAKVSVAFQGLPNAKGYDLQYPEKAGWRYGLVGITADGKSLISEEIGTSSKGEIHFEAPSEPLSYLWLVVMGAPTEHWMNGTTETDAQWPYKVKITGSDLL